jgi:hypothetical protein
MCVHFGRAVISISRGRLEGGGGRWRCSSPPVLSGCLLILTQAQRALCCQNLSAFCSRSRDPGALFSSCHLSYTFRYKFFKTWSARHGLGIRLLCQRPHPCPGAVAVGCKMLKVKTMSLTRLHLCQAQGEGGLLSPSGSLVLHQCWPSLFLTSRSPSYALSLRQTSLL